MPWELLLPISPNKWGETHLRWKLHKGLRWTKWFFFFFRLWTELWNLLPYVIIKGNTAARSSHAFEQLYYRNYDSINDIMVPRINVPCSTSCQFSESPLKHGIEKHQDLYCTKNTILHENRNTFSIFVVMLWLFWHKSLKKQRTWS